MVDWLIEWCFTPLSTVFQSYHCNSSHYSCLPGFHQYWAWVPKCLAQGHSHEKTQGIQCDSNPGPLDYESNNLPLSYAGPISNLSGASSFFMSGEVCPDILSTCYSIYRTRQFVHGQPSSPVLTHSHTMTPFDASGKEAFWKHCGKRRNCLYKQFLLFPQCFLLYQRQKLSFLLYLICRLLMLSISSGPKFCHVGKG